MKIEKLNYIVQHSLYLFKQNESQFWTCYPIDWKLEKQFGWIFLKWDFDKNKNIGKCAFYWNKKDKIWDEKILSCYGEICGETILPCNEFLKNVLTGDFPNELYGWFEFKALLNCDILNFEEVAPTLTTKQDRIPNSGIVASTITKNQNRLPNAGIILFNDNIVYDDLKIERQRKLW